VVTRPHEELLAAHPVSRADDLDEARDAVTRLYVPHALDAFERGPLGMRLNAVRVGAVTAGYLTYGAEVLMRAGEVMDYHVNIPVTGGCDHRCGNLAPVPADPHRAALYLPGHPGEMRWYTGAAQLCVMIERTALERELERHLGRPLGRAVRFDTAMDLTAPNARSWLGVVRLLDDNRLAAHPFAAEHLQNLVITGLLLTQPHNYSDALHAPVSGPAPSRAVRRAVELLEGQPERAWSSASLAQEVALSVRALQEGFRRAFDLPPMAYLREVRLNRVREELLAATPDSATVSRIAARWGFLNPGRFAAAYRRKFGCLPAETLRGRTS
jgi:AraC-like DNA-binding protein